MAMTTVFRTNRTQAVRLPKSVAFPDEVREVEVRVEGPARIIVPVDSRWQDWFARGTQVSDDFLADRAQGTANERPSL